MFRHYVNHRWLGGTLNKLVYCTRSSRILKRVKAKRRIGELADYLKKEAALLRREDDKIKSESWWFNRNEPSS